MKKHKRRKTLLKFSILFLGALQIFALTAQTNKYKTEGLLLLDNLNTKFYSTSSAMYVESVNTTTQVKSGTAFLWPAAHMMRALLWGSLLDSKYDTRLQSYVTKMSWYINGEGYGCIQNGERFFDDNGLVGDVLMDVYQKKIRTQAVLDKSMFALKYCIKYKDAQWGLPQKESELNKGIFYMGPVDPLSNAYAKYYTITGDTNYLNVAKTYFNKFNDYTLKLKSPSSLLFVSGSTFANGVWTPPNEGPRACNTAAVVLLGIRLYQITGEAKYLNASKAMADAILTRFYKYNGGFAEVSYWGGNYSVEMLCEMYEIDRDLKWYNAAKDICDFLIDKSRDLKGYYPDGPNDSGYWNDVRTNTAAPATVSMMSQACAANAILRFAYLDLNKPLAKGIYKIVNVASNKALSVKSPNTIANGSIITTNDFADKKSQKWMLDIDNTGNYTLKSFENGSSVAVKNCSPVDGNTLEIDSNLVGDCTKFKIESIGSGQYKLAQKAGKSVDAGVTSQNDDAVFLAVPADVASQKWTIERLEPKVYWRSVTKDTLVTTAQGLSLSVDVTSTAEAIRKVEYYINGVLTYSTILSPYTYSWKPKTSGQYEVYAFAYDKLGNIGYSTKIKVTVLCVEQGVYKIVNSATNKSLSVIASKTNTDAAEITTTTYQTANYQQWKITADSLGYYTFAPLSTGFNMGNDSCHTDNDTKIKQFSAAKGDCQKYYMVDLGLGVYQICAKNTTKAISAKLVATNDVPVYLWEKADQSNQKWKFTSITTGVIATQAENVDIYPNPVVNTLTIGGDFQGADIEIYTLTGLKTLTSKSKQIDVSGLSSGVYILRMKLNNAIYKAKFIKK
ncbi:MAG TPA: RICIN domain-containing protein [Paludibacter sp.]